MNILANENLNRKIEFGVPKQVSPEGMAEISTILRRVYDVELPADFDPTWMIAKGTYSGTFPKRVSSWLFKEHKLKATPEVVSEIGNRASVNSPVDAKYLFDFTKTINWHAGEFADAGSCFWESRSGAKDMISEAGGGAVRFYDVNRTTAGVGRAWVLPYTYRGVEMWAVFNGYGYQTRTIARVISAWLGLSYKDIEITNDGSTTGTLWINDGKAYLLHPAGSDVPDRVDFRLDDHDGSIECHDCGNEVHEDYVRWFGDNPYCESCYDAAFFYCDYCGEYYDREERCDVFTGRNNGWNNEAEWCDGCAREHASECCVCERLYRSDAMIFLGESCYCPKCAEKELKKCESCNAYMDRDDYKTSADGHFLCSDCFVSETSICVECGDTYMSLSVHGLCEDCLKRETENG